MKTKIITSNSSRGAYQGLLKEMKNHLSEQIIVIAPDRFTASVERGLISSLGIDSTFGIEVMSFSRLADKLLGKSIKKCLTPVGSVMLIGQVIAKKKSELRYYGKVAGASGFANELYAALTAIRNSGKSTVDIRQEAQEDDYSSEKEMIAYLREKANQMDDRLKLKTLDLALIYEGYLEALENFRSDSTTKLIALADFIRENPAEISGINFFCTDLYDFSSPEYDILREISKAKNSTLTISIPSGKGNDNERIYPDYVIDKLKEVCAPCDTVYCPDADLCPQADAIGKGLFYPGRPSVRAVNDGKVKIRKAQSRYDEVLALALDIKQSVMQNPQSRYKDYEVFAGNLDDYVEDIKSVFNRYNIRFFIDRQELLKEQTKVRYLLSAIAVVRSGFRRREVLDFVKNPLFAHIIGGGENAIFKFENYVLKYNIDRSRFCSKFELNDEKLRKETIIPADEQDKPDIVQVEEENDIPESVREMLEKTLDGFKTIEQGANIKEFLDASKKLLLGIADGWKAHVTKMTDSDPSGYYAKCVEQVDKKIDDVFSEIDEVLNIDLPITEFESILGSMFEQLKISLVPTYLDCVFFGDYNSRFMGSKHIYVLGATNDTIPRGPKGGLIINMKDEDVFGALGVQLSPSVGQRIGKDKYFVCDLMKKPRGNLVVSYPVAGASPSEVIGELRDILICGEKENATDWNNDGRQGYERVIFEKDDNFKDAIKVRAIDFDRLYQNYQDNPIDDCNIDAIKAFLSTEKSCYFEVWNSGLSHRLDREENELYGSAHEILSEEKKEKIDSILLRDGEYDISDDEDYMPSNSRFVLKEHTSASDSTSVSKIETYFECPYKFYLQYILSLKKRKDGKKEGMEDGIILHHILKLLFADIAKNKLADANAVQKAVPAYFDSAIKENKYEVLMLNPETSRLFARLKDEAVRICVDLYEIQKERASLHPTYLEAPLAEVVRKGTSGAISNRIDLGDREITLTGFIDRVDSDGDGFIIIDYKTYKSADFELKDLYYGSDIQIYVYLNVVKESIKAKPIGAFYLPLGCGFSKEDEVQYRYKGHISSNEADMEKIDNLAVIDSKKAITPTEKKAKIASGDFDLYANYAMEILKEGARQIDEGNICPAPVVSSSDESTCDDCNFACMCPYKGKERYERRMRKVENSSFVQDAQDDDENGGDSVSISAID